MLKSIIKWLVIICFFTTYGINIKNVHADETNQSELEEVDTHELESISNDTGTINPINNSELDGVPAYKKKNLSVYNKLMNHIHGKRHFKSRRGIKDPHYPKEIHIYPHLLSLPEDLHIEGIEEAVENGNLNINHITEEMLLQLSPQNKQSLIDYLSKQIVKMRQECKGMFHAHPIKYLFHDKVSAATAIALRMGTNAEYKGFTTILCETPASLLPKLKGRAKSLLDTEVLANTLVCLMTRVNNENLVPISEISTDLIQIYLKYWAGKDVERFDQYLRDLILRINELEANMAKFTPQQFGVLLGSLLAGSLWLCSKLKSADEKRQWMVNSIVNLIRAFTPFFGAVPWLAGNAAAIISGVVSVGVVSTAVAYNYFRTPRDYSDIVRKIQGQIKISALQSADPTSIESRLRVQEMVEYMDAVINVNGEPA